VRLAEMQLLGAIDEGQVMLSAIERVLIDYFKQLGCLAELSRDGADDWLLDTLRLSETTDDVSLTEIALAIAKAISSTDNRSE